MSPEIPATEWRVFALTDIGRVRKNNEDHLAISDLTTGEVYLASREGRIRAGPMGVLLLVADGMGGEASGEVASEICVAVVPSRLRERLRTAGPLDGLIFVRALVDALDEANRVIFQKARTSPLYSGMGTTATAAVIWGSRLFVGQVGDSRAYLQRGRSLVLLTRDQTFLNYLADIGAPLPDNLEADARRNILTQAVGTSAALDVKVTSVELCRGDRILLCSDGLYTMVQEPEFQALVCQSASLEETCRALVKAANAYGGKDNITVILAEGTGAALPEDGREPSPREVKLPASP